VIFGRAIVFSLRYNERLIGGKSDDLDDDKVITYSKSVRLFKPVQKGGFVQTKNAHTFAVIEKL
jgi:hypothetical protein